MIYVFDTPSSPLRLISGPGIGFTQGGDYISISYTGTVFTGTSSSGGGLTGLTQNRIPYVYTGSSLRDSGNLTFDGLDLTHYSGTATFNILTANGLFTANGGIDIPDGENFNIGNGQFVTLNTIIGLNGGGLATLGADFVLSGGSWSSTGMNMNITGDVDITGQLNVNGNDIRLLGGDLYIDTSGRNIGFNPGTTSIEFLTNRMQIHGPLMFPGLATGTILFIDNDFQITGTTNIRHDSGNLILGQNLKLDTHSKAITMRRNTSNAEIEVMKILTGTDILALKMPTSVGSALGFEILNTSDQIALSLNREGLLSTNGGFVTSGTASVMKNAGSLSLFGEDHTYMQFYPFTATGSRRGYLGFAGANVRDITLADEISGGNIILLTAGTGNVIVSNYVTGSKYYNGTYTPTWTASTSGSSIGNGKLVGRYQRMGNICHTFVQLDFGSSTNSGFGVWEFTLPITPYTGTGRFPVGTAFALDNGVADYEGACRLDIASAKVRVFFQTGSRSSSGASNYPMRWATSDTLAFDITYEVQ